MVITTLTVAFLALTSRETVAVGSSLSTTDAEQAATAALERSQAQILAPFFAKNLPLPAPGVIPPPPADIMGPDLMVSVARDVPNDVPVVSLNLAADPGKNLTNLIWLRADAAPPVLVRTNKAFNTTNAVEARDYVDLNRNGRYEPTGFVPSMDDLNAPIRDASGNPVIEWRVGDPQWIGIRRDPTRPHGPNNHFIARYAFIILPAGRTLDVNWIHNQAIAARGGPLDWTTDSYFRNQGVGAYELNLAAFLADVNSNYWNNISGGGGYMYQPDLSLAGGSTGDAFSDAREFLYYRYDRNKNNPAPASRLFASLGGVNYFPIDSIDAFANGPVAPFGSSALTAALPDANDNWNNSWPGADSLQHFFTIHDLWDGGKLPTPPAWGGTGFRARLAAASARVNTEDRYTYYRILAQLDTDSVPEKDDRLNINYRNLDVTGTNIVKGAATNFVPWTATEFFNAAADRLLTNEFFPYGIKNVRLSGRLGEGIPVFTNRSLFINGNSNNPPIYMPRLHQLLQIAANVYEATLTNDTTIGLPNPPTVFRPIFERRPSGDPNGDIYITHYVEEGSTFKNLLQDGTLRWHELDSAPGSLSPGDNFYDIPILFGARKGIPNFNEFTMHTLAEFKRNIEVRKDSSGRLLSTNQTFIMSVSNYFVAELYNSYGGVTNFYPGYPNAQYSYPRPLEWLLGNASTSVLTNQAGLTLVSAVTNGANPVYAGFSWTNGYRLTPVMTNAALASSVFYLERTPHFELFNNMNLSEVIARPMINRWGMTMSNRFRCFLFDGGRLVDCYTSARMNTKFDISAELERRLGAGGAQAFEQVWSTRVTGNRSVADGVFYQMEISRGTYGSQPTAVWQDYGDLAGSGYSTMAAAIKGFDAFLTTNTPNVFAAQAPFSPHARVLQVSSWQANDPLVHSTVYDLYDPPATNYETMRLRGRDPYYTLTNTVMSSPGQKNQRYKPWGGRYGNSENTFDYDLSEKDPGVFTPDFWDFPTQKFPNVGWLGRVHRGTPWQTIYLKSEDPAYSATLSSALSGNAWWMHTGGAYMKETFPTNDWRLLDIFTAAIHPNATRGRLSINQTNLAAWSAVFSAVRTTALTNDGNDFYYPGEVVIQPHSTDLLNGDTNLALLRLVEGINRARMNPARGLLANNFTRLSDLMAVPELTLKSPFIPAAKRQTRDFNALDTDYERLPQQILSLVKVGEPRYVVYAWGQSLKPADYTPGIGVGIDPASKVVRNYQITGETATRSVVRVEFDKDAFGRTDYHRPHAVIESFNILPNE